MGELERRSLDGGGRERQIVDRDDVMAAGRVGTDATIGVHVKAQLLRAPPGAVGRLLGDHVAGVRQQRQCALDRDRHIVDPADALERIPAGRGA